MNSKIIKECFTEVVFKDDEKNFTALCDTCHKRISGNVTNSFNFLKHVKVSLY